MPRVQAAVSALIKDMTTDGMLAPLEHLSTMTDDELVETETNASRDFAAYTLHAKLPSEMQGNRSRVASAFRKQRAEASERVWLAVRLEQERRRLDAL